MDFKVRTLARWIKAHRDATPPTVYVGISWDEIQRVGNRRITGDEDVQYPLIDRRMTRQDCKVLIERAGLPVPPKSACYFCPFHKPSQWQQMRRDEPELFAQAADLERMLNVRRGELGKDAVWLTRFGKPLDEAIPEDRQVALFDAGTGPGETCDEGVCWV